MIKGFYTHSFMQHDRGDQHSGVSVTAMSQCSLLGGLAIIHMTNMGFTTHGISLG
jgi:hypothetical protein